jgi:hypothetical protein
MLSPQGDVARICMLVSILRHNAVRSNHRIKSEQPVMQQNQRDGTQPEFLKTVRVPLVPWASEKKVPRTPRSLTFVASRLSRIENRQQKTPRQAGAFVGA